MKQTIKNIDIKNKKVIIRCDFNVPLKNGQITDDTRIVKSLPTIKYALENNARIILMSHLGRVKTEEDKVKNSLEPVAKRLSELLSKPVTFINETRGATLETAIAKMQPKDIILMQNTRYEDLNGKKESGCDMDLAQYWASLGDVFINDAFGTLHRAHASNVGISTYLPSAIGLLVEQELTALSYLFNPDKPFIIILGGAKVSDKIGLIENLVSKCDKILIGGGMAFTFLKAEGFNIGTSLLDEESLTFCKEIINANPNKIILPVDVICNNNYTDEKGTIKDITELKDQDMGLDIGPKTVNIFKNNLSTAKTILWNGPLGVYEFKNYIKGTNDVLTYLTKLKAKTVLGGGDIVAAASSCQVTDKLYHISTGGGATLEFLEGKELPGLKNIKEA
ncbi:MAG TPA: phosphoglycerate kinase [Candidatus Onthousia faecavium]|nr:phosphoglycerate kinase [Candidatus Onthousia faecavium]